MSKATPTHTTGAAARRRTKEAGPDAELIRLCREYRKAVAAYNANGGTVDCNEDPLWHAIEAIEEEMKAHKPRTLEGVLAKARLADDLDEGWNNDWPYQVVRDLLAVMQPASIAPTKRTSAPTA